MDPRKEASMHFLAGDSPQDNCPTFHSGYSRVCVASEISSVLETDGTIERCECDFQAAQAHLATLP